MQVTRRAWTAHSKKGETLRRRASPPPQFNTPETSFDSGHVHSVGSRPGATVRTIHRVGQRLNRVRSTAYFRCDGRLMRYRVIKGPARSPSTAVVIEVSVNAIDIKPKSFGVVGRGTRVFELDPRVIGNRARLPDWGWAVDRGQLIERNGLPRANRESRATGQTRIDIGFTEHVVDARYRRAGVQERRRHKSFLHFYCLRFN